MIILEKSQLEEALMSIVSYSSPKEGEPQKIVGGLLQENLSLGTKRRLQKIHKKLVEAYKEYVEDIKSIREEYKEDPSKAEEEFKILLKEEIKIDEERVKLENIEQVNTDKVYNFDIIEKYSE